MLDILLWCTEVFDLVRGPRPEVENVREEALPAIDAGLLQHRVELPARGAYKGNPLEFFTLAPGLTDESNSNSHAVTISIASLGLRARFSAARARSANSGLSSSPRQYFAPRLSAARNALPEPQVGSRRSVFSSTNILKK